MVAFIMLMGLIATAGSANQFIFWRLLTGLGASGVVPLALTLMANYSPMNSVAGRWAGSLELWQEEWLSVLRLE